MSEKNLVLELNAKIENAKIAGYLDFIISKTIGGIKFIFFECRYKSIKASN